MKNLYCYLCKTVETIAIICLVLMMSIIFAAAVMRGFGKPLNWSIDIALFLTAWAVFLGAEVAFRNGKLVGVDILTAKMPQRLQSAVEFLMYLLIIVFLAFIFYYGTILSYRTRARTFQGIPGFSYTWVTISIPVSSFLMEITAIRNFIDAGRKMLGKNPVFHSN